MLFNERVKETTTTTGTGTVTLAGAVVGFQSFSSAFPTATTVFYCITSASSWEVGQGTFTLSGTTLSRDRVLASSNAGGLVSFAAGSKDVFNTYPAQAAHLGLCFDTVPAGSTLLVLP